MGWFTHHGHNQVGPSRVAVAANHGFVQLFSLHQQFLVWICPGISEQDIGPMGVHRGCRAQKCIVMGIPCLVYTLQGQMHFHQVQTKGKLTSVKNFA